jgi:hypothetical protein
MQFNYIDENERELMESLEADKWTFVVDAEDRKKEATEIARSTMRKDRRSISACCAHVVWRDTRSDQYGFQAAYGLCPVSRIVRSIVGKELLWSNADSCSTSTSHGESISDDISRCSNHLSSRRFCTSSLTTIINSKSLSLFAVPFALLPNRKTFFGLAILTMRSVICFRPGSVTITHDYSVDRGRTQLHANPGRRGTLPPGELSRGSDLPEAL